jgi:hypothetical protein
VATGVARATQVSFRLLARLGPHFQGILIFAAQGQAREPCQEASIIPYLFFSD